jgi:hypothetical protein
MNAMPHLAPLRPVLALLLVLPLAACGDEPAVPSGERPIVVEPDDLSVASAVADPTVPRILNLVVEDGQVSGDTGVVQVKRNVPVRVVVVPDETDTLLVEGYGIRALATADVPTQVDFLADEPGEFRVLLEDSGRELLRLRVQ